MILHLNVKFHLIYYFFNVQTIDISYAKCTVEEDNKGGVVSIKEVMCAISY